MFLDVAVLTIYNVLARSISQRSVITSTTLIIMQMFYQQIIYEMFHIRLHFYKQQLTESL